MEARLADAVPDVVFHGAKAARLANTSCNRPDRLTGEIQVMTLDLAGVAVSAGSACSSGKGRPESFLQAMGADSEAAKSAIRVSLGLATRPEDVGPVCRCLD